jgi:hypothetical protein
MRLGTAGPASYLPDPIIAALHVIPRSHIAKYNGGLDRAMRGRRGYLEGA